MKPVSMMKPIPTMETDQADSKFGKLIPMVETDETNSMLGSDEADSKITNFYMDSSIYSSSATSTSWLGIQVYTLYMMPW